MRSLRAVALLPLASLGLLALLAGCGAGAPPAPPVGGAIPEAPPPMRATPGSERVHAPREYAITVERAVIATMRDGKKLYADVYRPNVPGKFPVVVTRTPYDRKNTVGMGASGATRGFVVIAQDVRGRFASEGEWYPFKHEAEDGYDTVEWAAALPYSNGKVAVTGTSYVGATTMLAAAAHPPHLVAILPIVTASDYHHGWTYQGGAFEQWFGESWTTGLSMNTLLRRLDDENPLDWTRVAPLSKYPLFDAGKTSTLAPYFQDWLAHPAYDDYWRSLSIEERWGDIAVPALHVGNWYDIFLGGTLRNYAGLRVGAKTEEARRGQRLIVGPGNHQHDKGEVDFGKDAERPLDPFGFFDEVMNGARAVLDKPVQIFVMGKNAWRGEDDWPLARAKDTRFRLHAGGGLDTSDPAAEAADSFVYDPNDPVPTRGGALCCSRKLPAGAFDQRTVE